MVIVIFCYFRPLEGTTEPGEVHLIHITPNFISTFPVQVFAFTCAQNVSFCWSSQDEAISHFHSAIPNLQRGCQ